MQFRLTHPTFLHSGAHASAAWLAAVLVLELCLLAAAAYALPSVAYCLAMLGAAVAEKRRRCRRSAGHDGTTVSPSTRFCILIPAHNESLVIAATLSSVAALDYPKDLVQCVVIADNCTDDTAAIARRALPGALVMERSSETERGKGYALNWALEQLLPRRAFDMVVIVDADTQIEPGFLRAMDRDIQSCGGESHRFVAQGLYQVHNTEENWRTALMAGALSLVHYVRPMARERWGTSAGLKGNGMCFAAPLFEAVQWRGDSITEDIDYGLDMIEYGNIRVRFVPDAVVRAQMPTDAKSAQGQRRRWEGGRKEIIRRRALPMLRDGMARRDRLRLDAALDLCCPPLAQLMAALIGWGAIVVIAAALRVPFWLAWSALWAAAFAGLLIYVIAGFRVSGAPRAAYRALAMAVVYVPWKIGSMVTSRAGGGWNRTQRRSMEPVAPGARTASDLETAGDL